MPASRPAALAAAGLGLALLGALPRPAAAAQTFTAVTLGTSNTSFAVDDNNATTGTFTGTLGWSFTVSTPVTVTALGYFDDALVPNGAATFGSHDVGLFDSGGSLLASTTVSSSSTADGYFVYGSPSQAVVLLPNVTYTLGGLAGSDPYAYDLQNANPFASQVTFQQDAYDPNGASSTALTYPSGTNGSLSDPNSAASQSGNGYTYFGPNFQFTPALSAAPEPSEFAALGLFALGLGGLLLRARRRAARAS